MYNDFGNVMRETGMTMVDLMLGGRDGMRRLF
jgi:hypothetical protein